jgi:hypothetical protein
MALKAMEIAEQQLGGIGQAKIDRRRGAVAEQSEQGVGDGLLGPRSASHPFGDAAYEPVRPPPGAPMKLAASVRNHGLVKLASSTVPVSFMSP